MRPAFAPLAIALYVGAPRVCVCVCATTRMSTPRSANPYFREMKRGFFLKCVLPRVEKIRVNVPLIEVNEELYVVKGNV